MPDVLICDRDRVFTRLLAEYLIGQGLTVGIIENACKEKQSVLSKPFGVVIVGVYEGDPDTLEVISVIHRLDNGLPIIAVGNKTSLELERRTRLAKVFYYAVQPVNFDELKAVIFRGLEGG